MEGYIDSYTQTPGWNALYTQQAGGCVYFPIGSYLYTPVIDVSGNGGGYVVTFKAKSYSSPGMIIVSDQYMSSYDVRELTSEWQEYSVTLQNGSQATQVVFMAMNSDFYLDDVVISDGGVEVPVATASTNFTRESFTANWEAANGASSYLLDVFTLEYNYDTTTFNPVYLFKDKEVTGTSYEVTEGEYDTPYYYEVAAKNGNSISKKSNRITVTPTSDDVETPNANNATDVTANSFIASWGESDIATKYYLHVVKYHKAEAQENYTFVNADFSEFTEGSLDNPRKELEYLFDGDWAATVPVMANGHIGINNEDISLFGQGAIASPLIQTSNGNNKVVINFDAVARLGMKNALVQLVSYDNNGAISDITEQSITLSEINWNKYNITFDNIKGVAATIIITSTEAGRMFIDNLNATISLDAEEEVILPIRTYDVAGVSQTVTDFTFTKNDRICYYVNASWAVRKQDGVVRQIPEVTSDASNIIWVDELLAGINNIEIDAANGPIEYYNLQGIQVDTTNLVPGFYIVRQGDKTTKVLINN